MNKLNVIGVDLAKNVIQVSVLSRSNRELLNRALSRRKFAEFLGSQRRSLVAFEACATAHHWATPNNSINPDVQKRRFALFFPTGYGECCVARLRSQPIALIFCSPLSIHNKNYNSSEHIETFTAGSGQIENAIQHPQVGILGKLVAYFFKRSRISASSCCSADGGGGTAGAASSFFFNEFIALITRNIEKAMMTKSTIVWTNFP